MVLMKAVKRAAGAGNKNPVKRNAFPGVSQDKLDEEIDCYIRSMGVAASFDLLEYKNLPPQQAEQPKALFKLNKLLEVEHAHLPGRASDALGILLKHWRRVTASQTAWEKFERKLEESHANQLQRLYKMMKGEKERPKREPTAHISDATMDSKGMPAMLKTSSEEDGSSDCDTKGSLMNSPPPVAKGVWREKAGKPLKKSLPQKWHWQLAHAKDQPSTNQRWQGWQVELQTTSILLP